GRVDRAPVSVELVIVTPDDESTNSRLGAALRESAGRTNYLQAIGINVLRANPAHSFDLPAVRRAFPWLLIATRRWYARLHESPVPSSSDHKHQDDQSRTDGVLRGRLARLELENYRLRGSRHLVLSPAHRIHLVHGRNGSGKSSVVEALEYML